MSSSQILHNTEVKSLTKLATNVFFLLPCFEFLPEDGWELGPQITQVRLSDWFATCYIARTKPSWLGSSGLLCRNTRVRPLIHTTFPNLIELRVLNSFTYPSIIYRLRKSGLFSLEKTRLLRS